MMVSTVGRSRRRLTGRELEGDAAYSDVEKSYRGVFDVKNQINT
jgi:hypothetical protein